MAIRYVKDFEFPSAAGFTDSATKVTGQMYAKGGEAKAPKGKGVMLIIGMGSPKGPMKKAEGGAISDAERRMLDEMAAEADATTSAERTMKRGEGSMTDAERRAMQRVAKKPVPAKKGSPYVPGTNIPASINYDEEQAARAQRGYKMGGKIQYEDGGKDTSVSVKDVKSGKVKQSKDADYYREMEQMKKPAFKKGGAMKHEDEAMDRKLVKQMIKPAALKEMGGGMAQKVQMAKSDAIEKSMKGDKTTPMAKGGISARSPLQAMGMAPRGMSLKQARGVPVGSRAPMISPLATGAGPMAAAAANRPAMGSRGVGVNEARAGKPDVGAIRMAMAKAASAANPDASPAMMKRGGKTSMSKC